MSADFPLTVPVIRIRRTIGPPDALGNDTEIEESTRVLVFAWGAASSDEPTIGGHDRLQVDVAMHARAGDFIPDDAVVLDDGPPFEVVGRPANYDANPWWSPGLDRVDLKRSER